MENQKPKGLTINLHRLAFYACAAVFCVSAVLLLLDGQQAKEEQQVFADLSAQIKNIPKAEKSEAPPLLLEEAGGILPKLKNLYAQNQDIYGWLSIENTAIDYPVMYTKEQPEFYLGRDFYKKPSSSGTPFISKGYTEESLNTLIYGHKMKSGTMFSPLLRYVDEEFYKNHATIAFDELYEEKDYSIFAVFYSEIYGVAEKGVFRYYNYYNIGEEDQFNDYIKGCKAAALYDTGITPAYGDHLLTLSTCSDHTPNGRLVVVAREN